MTQSVRYDPELELVLPNISDFIPVGMKITDLPRFRALTRTSREEFLKDSDVMCLDYVVPCLDKYEMPISVIARPGHDAPSACIYFLHGGGMVMGDRFSGATPLIRWAEKYDVVCVTPEYRLAPEFPAPTPTEDCYAGLAWIVANSEKLKIDPERIIIFGGSGGGGLAAGVTLMARDRRGPNLLGQLLQCPMIDDRNDTVSARQFNGMGVWDASSNQVAWQALLGERYGSNDVSIYSAPARADDLSGLPPTFIDVAAKEVFRDEAIAYAMGIMQAGGQCELHVWGDAYHGFYDIAPDSAVSQACLASRESWIERQLR
jgi:acetyl esterase/lipase